jgi:hypothetical protein
MKLPSFLLFLLLFQVFSVSAQNIGFNDNNSDPKASAIVDVYSTTKGMLIPRVALTSTSSASPVTSPETSLLIYNTATASDVTPGYYYWSGKWVRLVANADPRINLKIVTKTANAALLKTDNMVIASGDITLTLPAITSADNGLEITVKCLGTYMDQVTVTGATGPVTIDGYTSIVLYNYWSRTFIAFNGNWVRKENIGSPDNIFDVSSKSSWTTIAQVIEFLGAHMTGPSVVKLGGGDYPVPATLTINLDFPLTIEGSSYGESTIICPDDGSTAFDAQTECYFKMLVFQAGTTPGIGILLSGTDEYYEIKDNDFLGFTSAVKTTGNVDLWLFETDFEDCTASGIEIASGTNNVIFKISESDFMNCAVGINLLSYGTATEVSILGGTFYNNTGQTGIVYVPGNNGPYYSSIIIQNNSFNNVGSFASGFDFTLARDANIFMENNAGVPSVNPHCKINVTNSTNSTSLASTQWFKLGAFSGTVVTYPTKWSVSGNRITYQSSNSRDGIMFISGDITCSYSSGTKILTLAIVKNTATSPQSNPTRFAETTIRSAGTGQTCQFSTNVYLQDIMQNDYFEIWVSINTDTK